MISTEFKGGMRCGFGYLVLLALAAFFNPSQICPSLAHEPERLPVSASECHVPDSVAWSTDFARSQAPRLLHEPEFRIVVLGSSSTAGFGASSSKTSFVEQFHRAIDARSPRRVRIFNAGVPGDTTADMMRRLQKDVLDRKPGLVIWQTGVNDAIKRIPVDLFSPEVAQGIDEMKSRAIAIILIDQQEVIGASHTHQYNAYVSALHKIGREKQVALHQRYRVMHYLAERREGGLQSLLGRDGLHMNDYTHRCIGELLASGIVRLLG
jgi:lysophospholipase L1-like esterase